MKKIIATLAVVAMASLASAASFEWGNSIAASNKVKFDGTNLKADATFTATLVYLGNEALGTYTGWTVEDNAFKNAAVSTDSSLTPTSVFMGEFVNGYNTTITGTSDAFVDGATFGLYLTYTDADGTVWYNFNQATYTVTGMDAVGDGATLDRWTATGANFGSWATIGEVETLNTSKGGWQTVKTAVPEPATALIGLLGLGLMIKRRK